DFAKNPQDAAKRINSWVEEQTRQRIRNVISDDALNEASRLVLVNAIYMQAPWAKKFKSVNTKPRPFRVADSKPVNVPTMVDQREFGYLKQRGFCVIAIPYAGGDLQFLILLPDKVKGLAGLEKKLTAADFLKFTNLSLREIILYLPKLKLEPPALSLSKGLQSLGMKSAFDQPRGSANFNRIAPPQQSDYLRISDIVHKTHLNLDEEGTEAAAATVIFMTMSSVGASDYIKPIEVRVDRPFLFVIQHRVSGTCLFLGRVVDPR
ncbi:MAG: serpin family protein, partial [Akkermansiaceae bacterium]|nr:serpin family protein [Verrucomicrobiales bacterium]